MRRPQRGLSRRLRRTETLFSPPPEQVPLLSEHSGAVERVVTVRSGIGGGGSRRYSLAGSLAVAARSGRPGRAHLERRIVYRVVHRWLPVGPVYQGQSLEDRPAAAGRRLDHDGYCHPTGRVISKLASWKTVTLEKITSDFASRKELH